MERQSSGMTTAKNKENEKILKNLFFLFMFIYFIMRVFYWQGMGIRLYFSDEVSNRVYIASVFTPCPGFLYNIVMYDDVMHDHAGGNTSANRNLIA